MSRDETQGKVSALPYTEEDQVLTRIGWLGFFAVLFSLAYLLSDIIEVAQGGFSPGQLWLTLIAEAAIPPLVICLYLVQRPRAGRLGLAGALGYAYAFVYFTGTVVYALANSTPDYSSLEDDLGLSMTIHGGVMLFAGIAFGVAVIRARVFPGWTGTALIAGVVAVALAQGLPEVVQLLAASLRDLAFAGMGAALLLAALRGTDSRPGGRVSFSSPFRLLSDP